MLNSFLSEAVHINGSSGAITHDFELHHVVFFYVWGIQRVKTVSER